MKSLISMINIETNVTQQRIHQISRLSTKNSKYKISSCSANEISKEGGLNVEISLEDQTILKVDALKYILRKARLFKIKGNNVWNKK